MNTLSWPIILSFGAAIITTAIVWKKRGKLPLLYGLLIVVIPLVLCSTLFLVSSTPSQETPGSQVKETDIPDLVIQTSVPQPVMKDQSVQVDVSIFQRGQPLPSPSTALQPTVDLTPVGTPVVPIAGSFGPGYDVSAIAQFNASVFDVAPQGQQEQSLDQPQAVHFTWTIIPKYIGQQADIVQKEPF